jgi:hypothetical protein
MSEEWGMELLEEFRKNGFVTAQGLFDAQYIDNICVTASENFDELNLLIRQSNLHLGIGIKEGFSQVVQRHENRFEVPYKADDEAFSAIANHPQVISIATAFLGPDWKIINRSVLMSLPGSQVVLNFTASSKRRIFISLASFILLGSGMARRWSSFVCNIAPGVSLLQLVRPPRGHNRD